MDEKIEKQKLDIINYQFKIYELAIKKCEVLRFIPKIGRRN